MAVFAIALTGLSALTAATVRANGQARRLTAAANLALDKLDALRGTPYDALASGEDGTR